MSGSVSRHAFSVYTGPWYAGVCPQHWRKEWKQKLLVAHTLHRYGCIGDQLQPNNHRNELTETNPPTSTSGRGSSRCAIGPTAKQLHILSTTTSTHD